MKTKEEEKFIVKTIRIPINLSEDFQRVAKKNRRSFNGELITIMENHTTEYNSDWKNKH
jgi:Arc-like DNA binding domain